MKSMLYAVVFTFSLFAVGALAQDEQPTSKAAQKALQTRGFQVPAKKLKTKKTPVPVPSPTPQPEPVVKDAPEAQAEPFQIEHKPKKYETTQVLVPQGGESVVVGMFQYSSRKQSGYTSTSDFDSTNTYYLGGGSYEYGLSDHHSLSIAVNYGNVTVNRSDKDKTSKNILTYNIKISGLAPVVLSYQGNMQWGLFNLIGGVGYAMQTEKAKLNYDDNTGTYTQGQDSVIAKLGFSAPMMFMNMGSRFQYESKMSGQRDDTSLAITTNKTITGGDVMSFSVFGEIPNSFHPNLELKYDFRARSTEKDSTSSMTISTLDTLSVIASSRFHLFSKLEAIPQLVYLIPNSESTSNFSHTDNKSGYAVGFLARLTF